MTIRSAQAKPPIGARIDFRHPLADKLVGYWLINEGGGNTLYDLSANGNNMTNGGGTWTIGNSTIGVNVSNTGSTYFSTPQAAAPASLQLQYPMSMVFAMQKTTTWTNPGTNLFTLNRAAGISGGIRVASATQFRFAYLTAATSTAVTITAGLPVTGKDVIVGVTMTGTAYIWYVNGVAVQSGAMTTSTITYVDAFVGFGSAGQSGNVAPINVYWGGIWNRVLTPTEMADMVAQPYAHLRRPRQPFFGGTATAGPVSNLIYQAMIG